MDDTVLDPDLQTDLDLQTQRIEVFPLFHLPVDLTVCADSISKMLCQLVGSANEWLWNEKSKTVESGPRGSRANLARHTECKTVLVVGNDVKRLSPLQKNSTLHRSVP